MMKVVGEEGTSISDYITYQKAEFLDRVYLQQDSFHPIDAAVSVERQRHVFELLYSILSAELKLENQEEARDFFNTMRQHFLDYNVAEWQSEQFKQLEDRIRTLLKSKQIGIDPVAKELVASTD